MKQNNTETKKNGKKNNTLTDATKKTGITVNVYSNNEGKLCIKTPETCTIYNKIERIFIKIVQNTNIIFNFVLDRYNLSGALNESKLRLFSDFSMSFEENYLITSIEFSKHNDVLILNLEMI